MKPMFFDDTLDMEDRTLRARDGIITALGTTRGLERIHARSTWVVVARNDEPVEDFFLESPFGREDEACGEDPVPWICRGVKADGSVRMGAVDLDVDRFVSDVMNDELRAALRKTR